MPASCSCCTAPAGILGDGIVCAGDAHQRLGRARVRCGSVARGFPGDERRGEALATQSVGAGAAPRADPRHHAARERHARRRRDERERAVRLPGHDRGRVLSVGRAHGDPQRRALGQTDHTDHTSFTTRFSAAYDIEVQRWVERGWGWKPETWPNAWDGYLVALACEAGARARGRRAEIPIRRNIPQLYARRPRPADDAEIAASPFCSEQNACHRATGRRYREAWPTSSRCVLNPNRSRQEPVATARNRYGATCSATSCGADATSGARRSPKFTARRRASRRSTSPKSSAGARAVEPRDDRRDRRCTRGDAGRSHERCRAGFERGPGADLGEPMIGSEGGLLAA